MGVPLVFGPSSRPLCHRQQEEPGLAPTFLRTLARPSMVRLGHSHSRQ